MHRLTFDELNQHLPKILGSPQDAGELKAIVIRPETDLRTSLESCDVSLELGVHGDNWAKGCWKSLSDGSPHPDVQIAIMNSRTISVIAQSEERWSLAGDNLFVDLDLSRDNLPTGQRLSVGSAILEITGESHNGCRKFADRFGTDAVKFVNSEAGKQHRLRGVYARVVQDGTVSLGDIIRKCGGTREHET